LVRHLHTRKKNSGTSYVLTPKSDETTLPPGSVGVTFESGKAVDSQKKKKRPLRKILIGGGFKPKKKKFLIVCKRGKRRVGDAEGES